MTASPSHSHPNFPSLQITNSKPSGVSFNTACGLFHLLLNEDTAIWSHVAEKTNKQTH